MYGCLTKPMLSRSPRLPNLLCVLTAPSVLWFGSELMSITGFSSYSELLGMSKALDKSHPLLICSFSTTSLKCKGKLPWGKAISFLLPFLYFLPSTRRCLCLCLPAFHKSSLEMFVSCLHQTLYPVTALLNKNRHAVMYGNSLFLNIQHINHTSHWVFRIYLNKRRYRPSGQHAGTYILACSFSELGWDVIWIFFMKKKNILSSLFWSVYQKDAGWGADVHSTSHIVNLLHDCVFAFSSS